MASAQIRTRNSPNPQFTALHSRRTRNIDKSQVKLLEAGINIVTTADWITGWHRDRNHPHHSGKPVTQLLQEACEKGGSTFYGTGMNPGLNQILGVVNSADVADIENITTVEWVDVSCHHSKGTWTEVGIGLPVDDPEFPSKLGSSRAFSPTAC